MNWRRMSSHIEYISTYEKNNDFPSEWYDISPDDHFWFVWRFEVFKHLIGKKKYFSGGMPSGFEIGSGHGVLRRQIESFYGWSVDACDLNTDALEENRSNRSRTFYYNIFDRDETLKEKYDFILLFDVIEHIDDVEAFMDAALFHLKKGGKVFINVPAFQSMYSRYDEIAGHCRRYTKGSLAKEVASDKLVLEHIQYWGGMMTPFLLLRKWFFSSKGWDDKKILEEGFKPGSAWKNMIYNRLKSLELFFVKEPPFGTSVMASFTKKS